MIKLPPELYYIIIQYLDEPDDKRPLCRLAQTCKGMRDVVTPFIYRNNTFQYPTLRADETFDHSKLNPRYVNSITRFNCFAKGDQRIRYPASPLDQVIAFTKTIAPHLTHLTGSFAIVNCLLSSAIEINLTSLHIVLKPSATDSFFRQSQYMRTYPLMKEVTLERFNCHLKVAQCLSRMFPNMETLRFLSIALSDNEYSESPVLNSRPVFFETLKRLNIVCDQNYIFEMDPPARKEHFSDKLEQLHIEFDWVNRFNHIIDRGLPYPDAIKILSYTSILPCDDTTRYTKYHKRFLFKEFLPSLSNLRALQLGYRIDGTCFDREEPFSFDVAIRDILETCPKLKILAFDNFALKSPAKSKPKSKSSIKAHPLQLFRAVNIENLSADDVDTLTHCCADLQELTIDAEYCYSTVTLSSLDNLLEKFGPKSLKRLSFVFPPNTRYNRDMGKPSTQINLLKSIAQHCPNQLQYLSLQFDFELGSRQDTSVFLKTLLDALRSLPRLIYLSIPENSYTSNHLYTLSYFGDLIATVADNLEEFGACFVSSKHIDLVCTTLVSKCQKLRYIDVCASPALRRNPSYTKYKHLLKFVEQYPVDAAISDLLCTRYTTLGNQFSDNELAVRETSSWKELFRFGVLGYRDVKKLVDQISNSQLSS